MKTLTHLNYTGKKARIGSICFDEKQRLQVFVNYCENCYGKVVMPLDEARQFSKQYKAESERFSNKLLLKFVTKKRM